MDEIQTHEARVQFETQDLLQKTVDYLNPQPVVPMMRAVCREIEAHLADPSIAAAKRTAIDARLATP